MNIDYIDPKQYYNIIDNAIKNTNLDWYGTFMFEHLQEVLGGDINVNVLMNNGFFDVQIMPMTGVSRGIHSILTLNDRWRNLKRCGSYENLIAHELEIIAQQENKRTLELDFIKEQKEFQKTNNDFIAKQSALITSQLKTNESVKITNELSKITNIYIAIFTGVAGVYYISELLKNYIPYDTPYRTMIIYLLLLICVVAGIFGYLRMRQVLKRKSQE